MSEFIRRQAKREQLRRDALAAWIHYQKTGLHIAEREADSWLAKLEAGQRPAPPNAHE
jgi:predicted transcriptional regulator